MTLPKLDHDPNPPARHVAGEDIVDADTPDGARSALLLPLLPLTTVVATEPALLFLSASLSWAVQSPFSPACCAVTSVFLLAPSSPTPPP